VAALAALALLFALKPSGISPETARKLLAEGGRVIDVRSPEEFRERHLPGALNIPLPGLETGIAQLAPDKNAPLLLHCLSGGRSGFAVLKLKRLGYARAYNLGSYARAQKLLRAAGPLYPENRNEKGRDGAML